MIKTKECYCNDYKDFKILNKNFLSKFYKKTKQAIKPIAKWTGRGIALAYLISALSPKQANAWTGEGLNRGASAENSIIHIIKPDQADTVTAVANFYIPKMKGWYWSRDSPAGWDLQNGDTCGVYVLDQTGQKKQNTFVVVDGPSDVVMPLFLDDSLNYTIAVGTCNSTPDTLVEGRCRVKHNGNFSEELVDTFNISTSYHDLYFNLAKSDSVWNWTNGGNWDNLLGDSIFVTANAINYNEVGSSEGTIQRYWIDGDQLPDMVMEEQGVNENNLESKVYKYNLQFKQNPSKNHTFSCPAYAGKRKGLRVYDSKGGLVKEYISNNGKWDINGLNSGVYFAVIDHMRKKFTVME